MSIDIVSWSALQITSLPLYTKLQASVVSWQNIAQPTLAIGAGFGEGGFGAGGFGALPATRSVVAQPVWAVDDVQ